MASNVADSVLERPWIYVASPYTKGKPVRNVHFQCKVYNQLMDEGKVWPVVPLWIHFQDLMFPRPYEDWMEYDLALIPRLDGVLRLGATMPEYQYLQWGSPGADREKACAVKLGKPTWTSIIELYRWVEKDWPKLLLEREKQCQRQLRKNR